MLKKRFSEVGEYTFTLTVSVNNKYISTIGKPKDGIITILVYYDPPETTTTTIPTIRTTATTTTTLTTRTTATTTSTTSTSTEKDKKRKISIK